MDALRLLRQGAMMPQRRFGKYLKGLLDERGWSQERAALELGISEGLISMLISGKARPKLENVKQWGMAFRLSEKEAAVFYRLALLARSPTEVELEYLQMLDSLTPEDDDEDGRNVS